MLGFKSTDLNRYTEIKEVWRDLVNFHVHINR